MFGFFRKKEKQEPVKSKKQTVVRVKKTTGSKSAHNEILATLKKMQQEIDELKQALNSNPVAPRKGGGDIITEAMQAVSGDVIKSDNEKVIEGVFDGQNMVGADGQQYDVPPNYASKSKLVEGDILKLTINNMGSFVYKQIKPIDRSRKVGELEQDSQNLQFYAVSEGKKWRLLTASVTYFKGDAGDEVVFLIPTDAGSQWAAVENVIKK
jgi:hypothetical protein